MEQGIHNTNKGGDQNQQPAELAVHDDTVPQWVTDGHKSIIGHHGQNSSFQSSKSQDKADLGEESCVTGGFAVSGCSLASLGLWWW